MNLYQMDNSLNAVKETLTNWEPPYLCQPLINGIYCSAKDNQRFVTLYNQIGDEIHSVPHIPPRLNANCLWEHELTGMLWNPDYTDKELNDIILRSSHVPLHPLSDTITFYIYDIKSLKVNSAKRAAVLIMLNIKGPNLRVIPTAVAEDWNEIVLLHESFVNYHYDGSLIRKPTSMYDDLDGVIKLKGEIK